MSGGSFDYLCYEDFLMAMPDRIKDMGNRMKELAFSEKQQESGYAGYGLSMEEADKLDAVGETLVALAEDLEAKERYVDRYRDLFRAIEWWISGDRGHEGVFETYDKLMGDATKEC